MVILVDSTEMKILWCGFAVDFFLVCSRLFLCECLEKLRIMCPLSFETLNAVLRVVGKDKYRFPLDFY